MKSSSLDRRVISYPHPKFLTLFVAECHDKGISKSNGVQSMLRERYDSMPEEKIARLRKVYAEMTEEEKRFPGKVGKNTY
jgi:hypothetical protein